MIPLKLISFIFLFLIPSARSSQVSISVSRRSIPKSGDPITVKWSGVDAPSELDWLGIYSPANSSHHHFIGYLFLSSSPDWKSGSGSITIPLINLRSDYQFRIFHWIQSEVNPKKQDDDHNPLPGTKHLLAESETVAFEPGRGPEQVHLALTGRPAEMRVMFVTQDGNQSFVKYGLSRDTMDKVVGTQASRYDRKDMCDAPANDTIGWRDPGFIHDGVMVDLQQGKRYYYKVGSDSGGWSTAYTFVSPMNEPSETVAFLFGDMGAAAPYRTFLRTQEESISTIKWISRDIEAIGNKPALISHIGDISYARGYSWLWDTFFNQIEPVASKVPYHVCIGNHEYDWPAQPWKPSWSYSVYGTDGGGECGVPYSLRFHMPGNSSEPTNTRAPATRNVYYSFDMGVVHFVYFSTETNFLSGSKQYDFLKSDLESVDRSKTPFVVVQGHRPMYTTSHETRDTPFRERLQDELEPLFVKNNVTVALWGHVHRYERFCPLNNFTCGSSGTHNPDWKPYPVHLVIGMAGHDCQAIWEPRPDHLDDPIFPQPARSMYRGGEFGYVRLQADKEKLTLSYVGNHDGEVHDSVEIMASGEVFNGRIGAAADGEDRVPVTRNLKSRFSWYVKVASILVLGAFVGYVLGFISRHRKDCGRWTAVKTEET
ncbi:probable inactive purple acid phosphatase 2 [Andrographis paniculata]|uniref:probable inactive purple acid phosphatase 2 n=1 Tax=Andrographis paniculata TaxID=175694 RepID=UPI0021E7C0C5|nr:probable inactive purple acid phosphatase 2 [Andrographis paniculata]